MDLLILFIVFKKIEVIDYIYIYIPNAQSVVVAGADLVYSQQVLSWIIAKHSACKSDTPQHFTCNIVKFYNYLEKNK